MLFSFSLFFCWIPQFSNIFLCFPLFSPVFPSFLTFSLVFLCFYVFSCFLLFYPVFLCFSMFFAVFFFLIFPWFPMFSPAFLCFPLFCYVFPCFPLFSLVFSCLLPFFPLCSYVTCVANVAAQFQSKEQGTWVKGFAKDGTAKRAGKRWGRKKVNACRQTLGIWKPSTMPLKECVHRHLMLLSALID